MKRIGISHQEFLMEIVLSSETGTPTAYEILSRYGMQSVLARHIGARPKTITSIIRYGSPNLETKEKWAKGINEILGTSYSIEELFPAPKRKAKEHRTIGVYHACRYTSETNNLSPSHPCAPHPGGHTTRPLPRTHAVLRNYPLTHPKYERKSKVHL